MYEQMTFFKNKTLLPHTIWPPKNAAAADTNVIKTNKNKIS